MNWIKVGTEAPRDRQRVLVYTPEYAHVSVERYYEDWGRPFFGARGMTQPTHWMPLPACPALAKVAFHFKQEEGQGGDSG